MIPKITLRLWAYFSIWQFVTANTVIWMIPYEQCKSVRKFRSLLCCECIVWLKRPRVQQNQIINYAMLQLQMFISRNVVQKTHEQPEINGYVQKRWKRIKKSIIYWHLDFFHQNCSVLKKISLIGIDCKDTNLTGILKIEKRLSELPKFLSLVSPGSPYSEKTLCVHVKIDLSSLF